MSVLLAVLVFGAVWSLGRVPRVSYDNSSAQPPPGRNGAGSLVEDPVKRLLVCVVGAATAAWVVGGLALAVVGGTAGVGLSWWVSRLEPPSAARDREALSAELATTIDLLAACIEVGRPLDQSVSLVSRSMGGVVARRLDVVASRLALGGDPLDEWTGLATDAQLGPLARTVARSLESGAPLVDGLSRLADDRRRERRTETQLRARTVGVKAAGPLAACFLPAFMLIGVVPTIAGAFGDLVV
jgi:Flp pilus assembly protein TadB